MTKANVIKVFHEDDLASLNQFFQGKDKPVLILGPRSISASRIQQLTRQLIDKRPVVWGCLSEKYILGLDDSPQFEALTLTDLTQALEQLEPEKKKNLAILSYSQNNAASVIKKFPWSAVIGINGSWHRAFHYRNECRVIKKKHLPYKLVSSFVDEAEAKQYFEDIQPRLADLDHFAGKKFNEKELFKLATKAGKNSFDYTFQTGAVLAKNGRLLLWAHNTVVPYETYMLHAGASKEKHLTPPQDLNHFDTNHAEVELILKALKQKINVEDCSLYINLMPCPICARMLARTPLKEVVCKLDHSAGYAKKILGDRLRMNTD